MFITIIIFILTLLILVVIHELGHFLLAKKFDIKVEEFGFGIPPRAWGKKVGKTLVSINWLPFGGFVKLLGEDLPAGKKSFASQAVQKRIIVVVAGVAMNLILAILLFYLVLGFQGFKMSLPLIMDHQFAGVNQQNQTEVFIAQVFQDSSAEKAGLKPGEILVAVNGEKFTSNSDFSSKIKNLQGQEIILTLADTEKINFQEVKAVAPLGVALAQVGVAHLEYETSTQKLLSGPVHSWNLVAYSGKILGMLINQSVQNRDWEPVSHSVAGPVGITNTVNTILTESKNPTLAYLNFVALLSLNLAVLNIFPFPALDGGRLFFLLIEAVTRKKVHATIEKWIHQIGFAILLTLMLLVTFADLRKIFS